MTDNVHRELASAIPVSSQLGIAWPNSDEKRCDSHIPCTTGVYGRATGSLPLTSRIWTRETASMKMLRVYGYRCSHLAHLFCRDDIAFFLPCDPAAWCLAVLECPYTTLIIPRARPKDESLITLHVNDESVHFGMLHSGSGSLCDHGTQHRRQVRMACRSTPPQRCWE